MFVIIPDARILIRYELKICYVAEEILLLTSRETLAPRRGARVQSKPSAVRVSRD